MPETRVETPPLTAAAATSVRLIATAIVLGCLYVASSIIITLICALFLAFILEPGVKLMERWRIPRWLGSMVMVMASLAVVYFVGYFVIDRFLAFLQELPAYMARLKQIVAHFQVTIHNIQLSAGKLFPSAPAPTTPAVEVHGESPWVQFLLRGLGSAYGYAITVMIIPFLVFFMLASKEHVLSATMNLFPSDTREQARGVLRGISRMVRQYVLGNVLVALISAAVITPVFAYIGLRYALMLGPLAAFLSLIPYVGVALALAPPMLIAIVQPEYHTVGPYLWVAFTVVAAHILAINFLTPKLVGKRVKLNALSVTIAMMFWGWLWGAAGVLLAVPITASFKAVCDNVEKLKPYGEWLGEE